MNKRESVSTPAVASVWERHFVSGGERRLRRAQETRRFRLSRSLRLSLGLFVALIVLGAAHSLWTIHRLQDDQHGLQLAARLDHHFVRMVERADHYAGVAPRNYPDFFRDVELYYSQLREDIQTMDWLVADLAVRQSGLKPDAWNLFRNGLEQQIGHEQDRPRLEWAAEFIRDQSAPLMQVIGEYRAQLQQSSRSSGHRLWISSITLALATIALALVTGWLLRARVFQRIDETARAVRRMADGRFDAIEQRVINDELGLLESDVAQLALRSEYLIEVLDALNGAKTLQEAVDRIPLRLKRQFMIGWMGLVEIQDGRMYLRLSRPGPAEMSLAAFDTGWPLDGSLLDEACRAGHSTFATLHNADGALPQRDPLLRQLAGAGLATVALLPVRDEQRIIGGVLFGSRASDAFSGWRERWLRNVGHLIASAFYRSVHIERLGLSMVRGLAELAEQRDPTTGRHLERMQRYTGIIAREMIRRGQVDIQHNPRFAEQIETFAPLHDIGKVGITDRILLKPGPLTTEERAEMQRHPMIGAQVLMAVADRLGMEGERLLAHGMDIALYHHERYDGNGYPNGLVGKAIPLSARIVAVADVFDALTSTRPYKQAWSESDALDYIRAETGSFFDPEVVDALLGVLDEIRTTRQRLGDGPRGKD